MYKFIKRFFDIIFSLILIILLLPIFIPVIFILRFSGENEVFYKQIRIGYGNKLFGILKFATMVKNSTKIGSGIYTAENDPRILPVGKFLRKSKINELPQIFNILYGNMSFVGPRPLISDTFLLYSKEGQQIIGKLKPGLTGIGSIFFRDEDTLFAKSDLSLPEYYKKFIAPNKEKLEIWYSENNSLTTDFKILIVTLWVVIFPKSKIVTSFFKNLPKINV